MKRLIGAFVVLGLIGGAVGIGLKWGASDVRRASERIDGVLYEHIDEVTRAKIFVLRALTATELRQPLSSRTYGVMDDLAGNRQGNRGVFSLTASDCAPRDNVHTCRGSTEAHEALITVALLGVNWEVVGIDGEMPDEDRGALMGFSLPDKREPSHWDMSAAAVGEGTDRSNRFVEVWPFWVGPYPTDALGSVCEATPVDALGAAVGLPTVFYQESPNRPFEVDDWARGGGVNIPAEAVDATVECTQYTGKGWVRVSEPRFIGSPERPFGVEATMRWVGDPRFTTPLKCHVTLLDENGEVVWEDDEFVPALWHSRDLETYPYETDVAAHFPSAPPAAEVGSFDCASL